MQLGDYIVKPSSKSAEEELIDFLKFNNFSYGLEFENISSNVEHVMVVNVIRKTYFNIDEFFVPHSKAICETEFLDKVKYHPQKGAEYKVLCNDELVYEGFTRCSMPYGLGVAYYPNGNIYRDGIFYIKGIIEGREYYSSGQLKFEGKWLVNRGYGPNYPTIGNYYAEDGKLIFSGKFQVKKGGVGFPMMKYPKYRLLEKDSPKLDYVH
ncbi:hypothetical protein [Methanobrevibacter sp.]|uniref:hypothetical protein n=1 Tax=Methanobrevibacter sp. TaxID=66852 RepID=UPI0025DF3964|nr:hypothetical protein [Methanobrevibacter sp.]MBR4447203.1 hypothetical protein [Methanobrevibacter sp.]